jgi:hypothetical protein
MSEITANPIKSGPGRRVSIRHDEEDFVVAFQPEDFVIFRNRDANALRKVCRFFQWEIVTDTASLAGSADLAKPEAAQL